LFPFAAPQPAPLARPNFYWGIGIENCWIAQTNFRKDGNRRLLDVFLQMQHYDRWRADLDLAKEIGFNAIRYSVPWYKSEPKPGVYDWSWIDKPIEYLVSQLKIVPIMDLIQGMDLEMRAIREAIPHSVIVSIDPFFDITQERFGGLDRYLSSPEAVLQTDLIGPQQFILLRCLRKDQSGTPFGSFP